MLLFALGNLLYNCVYHDHLLWKFNPDVLNYKIIEIIYTFIVFPLTALIFLSHFPDNLKERILRILKYAGIYFIIEYLMSLVGWIEYYDGWSTWWSLGWDLMMFSVLATHYLKPVVAIFLCILVGLVMNLLFPFQLM